MKQRKIPQVLDLRDFQRTGRDSNPRYAFDVHTISNRALSTTQTPAHFWEEPLVKGCGGNIHEKWRVCKLNLKKNVFFLRIVRCLKNPVPGRRFLTILAAASKPGALFNRHQPR